MLHGHTFLRLGGFLGVEVGDDVLEQLVGSEGEGALDAVANEG